MEPSDLVASLLLTITDSLGLDEEVGDPYMMLCACDSGAERIGAVRVWQPASLNRSRSRAVEKLVYLHLHTSTIAAQWIFAFSATPSIVPHFGKFPHPARLPKASPRSMHPLSAAPAHARSLWTHRRRRGHGSGRPLRSHRQDPSRLTDGAIRTHLLRATRSDAACRSQCPRRQPRAQQRGPRGRHVGACPLLPPQLRGRVRRSPNRRRGGTRLSAALDRTA